MNASNAYISCRCVMQRTDLYRARVLSVTNSRLIPKSSCCPYSRRHIQTFAAHPKLHSAPIKTKCPPQRRIHIPTLLIPPLAFASLFIALNFYKNLVLILFQNRIIYMPSMPPFARRERIADYAAVCRPVTWREERIHAVDGTELALAVGEVEGQKEEKKKSDPAGVERKGTHLVIIYFQGNGSSTPPCLPSISSVLTLLHHHHHHQQSKPSSPPLPTQHTTILALSYRGFWTSRGRPSEPGIRHDAAAVLAHARHTYPSSPDSETRIVLWGQSLGAGVAIAAAIADSRLMKPNAEEDVMRAETAIQGLVLETPFTSIRAMLLALYPQKWLPYSYLGLFLRNRWDSAAALRRIGSVTYQPPSLTPFSPPLSPPLPLLSKKDIHNAKMDTSVTGRPVAPVRCLRPKILILQAGKDELGPAAHGVELESICRERGLDVRRVEIKGALHTEVMGRERGKVAVVEFLREIRNG